MYENQSQGEFDGWYTYQGFKEGYTRLALAKIFFDADNYVFCHLLKSY